MIIDELALLERYRKAARHQDLDLPHDNMLPADEINYLRGQLNAKFYLEAEPWMLPSWAVLTLKDFDKERNIVTEFQNTMYGNYSLIGGVGARKYGTADSRGLISSKFDCGSIDFWLQDGQNLIFPALIGKDGPQLRLVSSDDQVYEWKTHSKSIEFTRLVYHVVKDGAEYIYNEINLQNHDLDNAKFTFYALIRPMSVLGFEPIESIQYDAKRRQLYVNGLLALMFDASPIAVASGEAFDTDFPQAVMNASINQDESETSLSGNATISLKFEISLTPAGSQRIFFWSPLASISSNEEYWPIKPVPEDRDRTIGEWFEFSDIRVKTTLPEEQMDTVLSQAAVSLAIHAFPVMFPDVSHLAALNWRERMRILIALIRSGSMSVVEKIVEVLTTNMNIPDESIELSTFSPLLWAIHQYLEYTQGATLDENLLLFLKHMTSGVVAAVRMHLASNDMSDTEALQHHLVIREGVISDFEQMLWNLAALKSALTTISPIHETDLINSLSDAVEQYQAIVHEYSKEIDEARWLRTSDPMYERVEDEILNLLSTAALFRGDFVDPSFLQNLHDRISSRRVVNGLWKFFQPADRYSSYLALRLAQFYLLTRQRDKVESLLNRALDFLSDDYHLPEFVNPRSFGGSGHSGLCAQASADLILLMSEMLASETDSTLIVLSGVPEEWFTSKKPLIVDRLPLTRGLAHIEIGMSANQYQIEVGMQEFPDEIEFHVPPSVPMSMVKVYGGSIVERAAKVSSPYLKVLPLSDEIVLTYHR